MQTSRRDLFKLAMLQAAAMRAQSGSASMADVRFQAKENVRIGVIGTGGRGSGLTDNFASVPGTTITALCDVVKEKVQRLEARLDRAGKASHEIAMYTDGDHAFEQLVKR